MSEEAIRPLLWVRMLCSKTKLVWKGKIYSKVINVPDIDGGTHRRLGKKSDLNL